jgi:hypothetical protein
VNSTEPTQQQLSVSHEKEIKKQTDQQESRISV